MNGDSARIIKDLKGRLAESEKRYAVLVEKQLELMFRWLPDTTLTYVNEGFC